jgi:formate dehydrogenase major subunit/formate dehydrogenase alpha subunit
MPYSSLEHIMDEIEELVPFYQGTGYTDSEMKGIYRAEFGNPPPGARRLYKGQFPSGFGRFSPVHYVPNRELAKDGYPLTLITGTSLYQFGSGSRTSRASRLNRFLPEAPVDISNIDASHLEINEGDRVKIVSPSGQISAKARITDTVTEGMLFMPIAFPESPVNALFDIDLDPQSKTPSLKACSVRLERIDSHE